MCTISCAELFVHLNMEVGLEIIIKSVKHVPERKKSLNVFLIKLNISITSNKTNRLKFDEISISQNHDL